MTPGLVIRSVEPGDAEALAFLLNLPGFRHGTMRLPFETVDTVRGRLSRPKSAGAHIVAVIDATIVGSASLDVGEGRPRHVGSIGLGFRDGAHVDSLMMARLKPGFP